MSQLVHINDIQEDDVVVVPMGDVSSIATVIEVTRNANDDVTGLMLVVGAGGAAHPNRRARAISTDRLFWASRSESDWGAQSLLRLYPDRP